MPVKNKKIITEEPSDKVIIKVIINENIRLTNEENKWSYKIYERNNNKKVMKNLIQLQ